MLMEVRKSLKLMLYYSKFNLLAAMEYRVAFLMQTLGMMLNNTAFIFFWYILFENISSIGGAEFRDVMLLWAFSSSAFGLKSILFGNINSLTRMILNGELDSYLIQPKDPLINIISSKSLVHGWGDFAYGLLLFLIIGDFSLIRIILFLVLVLLGSMIFAGVTVAVHGLSFFFGNMEGIGDLVNEFLISFSIYPEGIFSGGVKFLIYSVIPAAFISYIPASISENFTLDKLILVVLVALLWIVLAYFIFYKGLKRYESGNLIISKL